MLKNIAYGEHSVISRIYTRDLGLRSYIINGVRKPKSKINMAILQPLNLLDLEVYEKESSDLQRIKEIKCVPILYAIHEDFKKRGVALFMVELLNLCLQSEEGEATLYDLIESYVLRLESEGEATSMPIFFTLALSREFGIEPHGRYSEQTPYFDLVNGQYQPIPGGHSLSAERSQLLYLFQLMERSSSYTPVGRTDRREILDALIAYFQIHLLKQREFKSLDVLKEVMDTWHNL